MRRLGGELKVQRERWLFGQTLDFLIVQKEPNFTYGSGTNTVTIHGGFHHPAPCINWPGIPGYVNNGVGLVGHLRWQDGCLELNGFIMKMLMLACFFSYMYTGIMHK